jgi:hypothetical protein
MFVNYIKQMLQVALEFDFLQKRSWRKNSLP